MWIPLELKKVSIILKTNLPSIPIFQGSKKEALSLLEELIVKDEGNYVCFCEANILAHASKDVTLLQVLQGAALAMADGVVCQYVSLLQGKGWPQRYPGPSFMLDACAAGIDKGYRHFFYGGSPGVTERMSDQLRLLFPGIQIVGLYSPPFRPLTSAEEADVKKMLEEAKPDLLWVGLGGPKQEFWMAGHVGEIKVPVMLGVGAAFDFHSGNRPWAPRWIRQIGMEWLFRSFTGGRRTFLRNIKCVSLVAHILLIELSRAVPNRLVLRILAFRTRAKADLKE